MSVSSRCLPFANSRLLEVQRITCNRAFVNVADAALGVIQELSYACQMRLSGTLKSWNEERGFGFIAPTSGGADVFMHISSLPKDGTHPTIGEKVTYELGLGKNGKQQAVNVIRVAFGDTRKIMTASSTSRTRRDTVLPKAIGLLLVLAIASYGYHRYTHVVQQSLTTPTTLPVEVEQTVIPERNPMSFICDGRTYCSQMTSCAEAKFFLKNCPDVKMDGNNDGTPCEKQWCKG